MPDRISQFVAWSDNANEYADAQREKLKNKALEDIDALLNGIDERDPKLWDELGVDAEQVAETFDNQPVEQRGVDWAIGLAAIATASGIQFFLDNRDELVIFPAAYRAQVMSPFTLTRSQLVQAGRREIVPFAVSGYQELQAKYLREFSFLKDMSNTQLFTELQQIGGLQPIDKYVADSMGYVSRMTAYPPGSPQYKEAVADLVNMQSTGAQQRMNRRSIEAISVERQTRGDDNILMCWVLDPTSSHCTYCPDRAGEILTMAEWRESGLPGAEVCRGGDRCNCHLIAV